MTWQRVEFLAERNDFVAIVKNKATKKPLARLVGQRPETIEIARRNSAARLDFDPHELPSSILKYNIDFLARNCAEVVHPRLNITPANLLAQFLHHEVLDQGSDLRAHPRSVKSQQIGCQPRIVEVQLGRFH